MRVHLACRRSRIHSWAQQNPFVEIGREIISMLIFYGHSLPSADSSRAVVSYRQKDGHLALVNCLGSLFRNSVVRLTERLDLTIVVDWDVKPQNKHTKTYKITCAPWEGSDQPAQPRSLMRLFTWRSLGCQGSKASSRAQGRLL